MGRARAGDLFQDLRIKRPEKRVEAPAFALKDLKGDVRRLGDFRGSVVVLNFWATWCRACREEMPPLERLYSRFRERGLVVVAVNVDMGFFSEKTVKRFIQDLGAAFPVLLDFEGRVRRTYEVTFLPTTYIIGRDGTLRGRVLGGREWGGPGFDVFFEKLLEDRDR